MVIIVPRSMVYALLKLVGYFYLIVLVLCGPILFLSGIGYLIVGSEDIGSSIGMTFGGFVWTAIVVVVLVRKEKQSGREDGEKSVTVLKNKIIDDILREKEEKEGLNKLDVEEEEDMKGLYILDCNECHHTWGYEKRKDSQARFEECPNCNSSNIKIEVL